VKHKTLTPERIAAIGRRFAEGATAEQLVAEFSTSISTIYRALHECGAQIDTALTTTEKRTIAKLTREGMTQNQIAAVIGRSRPGVAKWQRRLKARKWREVTAGVEREITAMLRCGIGQYRTAKALRVPETAVRKLMRKFKIHHPNGGTKFERREPEIAAKVRAAVVKRENYCCKIAEKFGVGRSIVERIAHEVHGEGHFVSNWEPMTSKYPSKCPSLHSEPDVYVSFVKKLFPGGLPETRGNDALVSTAISTLLFTNFPEWQNASVQQLVALDLRLLEAVGTIRAQEGAQWTN